MAARTRPYKIVWKGETRMVEAVGPAQAAAFVVGIEISELRAATPSEVAQWMRAGNLLPVAGDEIARGPAPVDPDPTRTAFDADDAQRWLVVKLGGETPDAMFAMDTAEREVVNCFALMREVGSMALDEFRLISEACPAFGEAIAFNSGGTQRTIEDVASELRGGETIDFQDVVTAIEQTVKRENLEAQSDRA